MKLCEKKEEVMFDEKMGKVAKSEEQKKTEEEKKKRKERKKKEKR